MSNYSHALKRTIQECFDGKLVNLSSSCDVPHSMISRHCSGNFRPDLASLEKICSALPPGARASVAIAHLEDETPPSARNYVLIESRDQHQLVLHESEAPSNSVFLKLDKKTQRALEFIALQALDSQDACDALQSTAKFLGAEL